MPIRRAISSPSSGNMPGGWEPLHQLDPAVVLGEGPGAGSARPRPRGRLPRAPLRARRPARGCRVETGARPRTRRARPPRRRPPRAGRPRPPAGRRVCRLSRRRSSPSGSGWSSTRRSMGRSSTGFPVGARRGRSAAPRIGGREGRRPQPGRHRVPRAGAPPRKCREGGAEYARTIAAGTVLRFMMLACALTWSPTAWPGVLDAARHPCARATRPPRSIIATWRAGSCGSSLRQLGGAPPGALLPSRIRASPRGP